MITTEKRNQTKNDNVDYSGFIWENTNIMKARVDNFNNDLNWKLGWNLEIQRGFFFRKL